MEQQPLIFNRVSARDSQKLAILDYLKAGNRITPLEALDKFRCMRLGGRVYDLKKDGFEIEREMVTVPSGKRVASYKLKQ
jgi:hypothetical protein